MAIERRTCSGDDLPAFFRFFARHWGPDHILVRDPAFALWQMSPDRTDAFGPEAAVAGVGFWDGPDLLGFIGAMPMDFNMDGKVLPGAWLCNLLADPASRARGVGLKLMTAVHDLPFAAVGAVGINLSVIPMYRAMRYLTGDRVPRMIRIVDQRAFERLVEGASASVLLARFPPTPRNGSPAVIDVDRIGPDWDRTWDRIARAGYFGTHRDSRFVNWRYAEHPRLEYRLSVAVSESGSLCGLAVHRDETVRGTDILVTRLIELLSDNQDAALALTAHVEATASRSGAAMIDHYGTRAPFAALRSAGWFEVDDVAPTVIPNLFQPLVRQRRDMNFAVRLLARSGVSGDVADRLSIVKSDGDQDRPN